jgi:hypothetical protein
MRTQKTHLLPLTASACLAAAALLSGCGPGNPACPGDGTSRYLPLAVGAQWTYAVVEPGVPAGTKTNTVEAQEVLTGSKAGVTALRVRTAKQGDGDHVSWQEIAGDRVLRHREVTYSTAGTAQLEELYLPSRLRVDQAPAHASAGASWPESYTERTSSLVTQTTPVEVAKEETWTVLAAAEVITVPAGTYTTLKVRKVSTAGGAAGSDKTYWYARSVGKVKEVGTDRTEELSSCLLP